MSRRVSTNLVAPPPLYTGQAAKARLRYWGKSEVVAVDIAVKMKNKKYRTQ